MGKSGGAKELERFLKKMRELEKDVPQMIDELAVCEGEVIVGMIKERTPWITHDLQNNFHSYKDTSHSGSDSVTIAIANNLEYASYVEKGHRQTPGRYVPALGVRLKKGWVQGRFMMRTSVRLYRDNVMEGNMRRFIDKKMKRYFDD